MNSSEENECPGPDSFPVYIDGAVGANMGEFKLTFCRTWPTVIRFFYS